MFQEGPQLSSLADFEELHKQVKAKEGGNDMNCLAES